MNEYVPPRRVQLREAKAGLSALVSAAERGEETIITRRGKPVARIVPVTEENEPKRVNHPGSPYHGMTFGELLLAFPGPLEIERDRTPMRVPDL
jgi:prevent-host-death family protein